MVRRRLFRRKRLFKRRYRTSTKSRTMRFATGKQRPTRSLRRIFKSVNMMAEKKIRYSTFGPFTVSSTANYAIPAYPNEGTSNSTRIGNNWFYRYMKYTIIIRGNGTILPLMRMAVVWPKTTSLSYLDLPLSLITMIDLDKFVVLQDTLIQLQNTGTTNNVGVIPINRVIKKTWKIMKNIKMDGTTPQDTMPFIWFFTEGLAPPYPTVEMQFAVTYTDV